MANQILSFQEVTTLPTSGLVIGRIYFEVSTGIIKVATSATTYQSFGGVTDAALINNILTLTKSSGEVVRLDLTDMASASAVTTALATEANIVDVYTKTEVFTKAETTANIASTKTALIGADGDLPTANTIKGAKAYTDSKISTVYKYKGTVADFSKLPTTGNVLGDVYNVEAAHGTTPAGTNYAWNGTIWDPLGGSVDLTIYAKTSEVANTYATKIDLGTTNTNVTNLQNGKVSKLATPLTAASIGLRKIALNTDGLVTSYSGVVAGDIPDLPISKIQNLTTTLSGKEAAGAAATALIDAKAHSDKITVNGIKQVSQNINVTGSNIIVGGTGSSSGALISNTIVDLYSKVDAAAAGGVTSVNGITGAVVVTAGSNITLSPAGKNISISAQDTTYADATQTVHGLLSTVDKVKLDNISAGAEVNTVNSVTASGASNLTLTANTSNKAVTIAGSITTSTVTSGGPGVTIASDVKQYVDSQMVWVDFI